MKRSARYLFIAGAVICVLLSLSTLSIQLMGADSDLSYFLHFMLSIFLIAAVGLIVKKKHQNGLWLAVTLAVFLAAMPFEATFSSSGLLNSPYIEPTEGETIYNKDNYIAGLISLTIRFGIHLTMMVGLWYLASKRAGGRGNVRE